MLHEKSLQLGVQRGKVIINTVTILIGFQRTSLYIILSTLVGISFFKLLVALCNSIDYNVEGDDDDDKAKR